MGPVAANVLPVERGEREQRPTADSPASRWVRAIAAVSVTIIMAALGAMKTTNADLLGVLPLFILVISVQLLPLWAPSRVDPFSPVGSVGMNMGLGLFSALAYFILRNDVAFDLLPQASPARRAELLPRVLFGILLATSGYYFGYFVVGNKVPALPFGSVAGRVWRRGRLWVALAACSLVFLATYVAFQGRLQTELTSLSMAEGKAVWAEDPTNSWIVRGVALGFLPALLYVAYVIRSGSNLQLAFAAVWCLVVSFLITRLGQRGFAVYFLMTVVMVVHYMRRRMPVAVLAGFAVAAVVTVNALGRLRSVADEAPVEEIAVDDATRFLQPFAEHEADRQRMGGMAVVYDVFPERHDHLLGASWVGVPLSLVPRWLWPEKKGFARWSDTSIVYEFTGAPIPSSLPTTLYANFSWFGMLIGMVIWGAYQRGLYRWLEQNQGDPNVVVVYCLAVTYFGPTALQISSTIQYVLPTLVMLYFVGKRTAAPRVAPARG